MINTNTYKGSYSDCSTYGGVVMVSDFDTENNKTHHFTDRILADFKFDKWCKYKSEYSAKENAK